MAITTPSFIPVPFGSSGLRNDIPTSSSVYGQASYQQGFPSETMQPLPPVGSGVAPKGKDFNGIFYALSSAIFYMQAGNKFPFDPSFASLIGGYDVGAEVISDDKTKIYRNTIANNKNNPNTTVTGWVLSSSSVDLKGYLPLAGGTIAGNLTVNGTLSAVTPALGTSTTQVATTEFVSRGFATDSEVVKTVVQTLSEAQKQQARTNIGVGEIGTIVSYEAGL